METYVLNTNNVEEQSPEIYMQHALLMMYICSEEPVTLIYFSELIIVLK